MKNRETYLKKESPDEIPRPDLRTTILVVSTLWGSSHCKPNTKQKSFTKCKQQSQAITEKLTVSFDDRFSQRQHPPSRGDIIHRSEQNSHIYRRVSLGPSGRGSSGGSVSERIGWWLVDRSAVSLISSIPAHEVDGKPLDFGWFTDDSGRRSFQ